MVYIHSFRAVNLLMRHPHYNFSWDLLRCFVINCMRFSESQLVIGFRIESSLKADYVTKPVISPKLSPNMADSSNFQHFESSTFYDL